MSDKTSDIPVYGTDFKTKEEDVPVFLYKGHYYKKETIKVMKDHTKGKIDALEKPVDDFNKLIRKCSSTQL